MEIIRPAESLEIKYSITTEGGSSYLSYGSGGVTDFDRYDRVYSDPLVLADGDYGNGHNYQLLCWDWDIGDGRPEDHPECWRDLGTTFYEVDSYSTDASYTEYGVWTSGSAVSAGETRRWRTNNYEALVSLTTAENTTNPESAINSLDATIAARWVDKGPANAFRCVDGETATVTEATGSIEMTIVAKGRCDRIGLWAMSNVASVTVDVNGGEMIDNPLFESSAIGAWEGDNGVGTWVSDNDGEVDITNIQYPTTRALYGRKTDNFTVGEVYTFAATVAATAGVGWELKVYDADNTTELTPISGGSAQTGNGSDTLRFTATSETHYLYLYMPAASQYVTLQSASCKQYNYTEDNLSATLKDATTGICKRNVILSHDVVTDPEYTITLTGIHEQSPISIGLVSAGKAVTIGCTHTNVEVGGISFSRLAEDQYGDVRKVRRRRARKFTAIVQLSDLSGDLLDQVLTELEGVDASFDFNSTGTSYSRLQIHGWAENWSTIVTGFADQDTMSISMRSLVEAVYG